MKEVARETLEIIDRGSYTAPSGRTVDVRDAIAAAIRGTRVYAPDDLRAPFGAGSKVIAPLRVEVTRETTAEAGRRLVQHEGVAHVVGLNFASAKNPGGGFKSGAKAQEEDLARCSALYACQLTQPRYYDANRACGSMLYTDHIIYSPDVPFFRDDAHALLEEPFVYSIITAPAPNAGEAAKRPGESAAVKATLHARARMVLDVARRHEHTHLVLGAWGCGVFRNDPRDVADAFGDWLAGDFRGAFERVVFAVYDPAKDSPRHRAFAERFRG